jgi:hypothetical protein
MGAHPYWYFVPYQKDINKALQELRQREFQAGRYNPVMRFPEFPVDLRFPSLGAQHDSIDDAIAAAGADGTRSILDIESVDDEPDFGVAGPLDEGTLESFFETTHPTHEAVEENMDFLDDIERGHCVYIIVFKDNRAEEIFFGGYSYD